MDPQRFLNDIIKPWDELNSLLSQRYAFEPGLSSVTRMVGALAVALKHQADWAGLGSRQDRTAIDAASTDNAVMSDLADYWKHGPLHDPNRDSPLSVAAMFEYVPDRGFRFLRNGVFIQRADGSELDFMCTARDAARYWAQRFGWMLNWAGILAEGPEQFHSIAFLYFNPDYCLRMRQTRFMTFSRMTNGSLVPVDPPEMPIAVYEMSNRGR